MSLVPAVPVAASGNALDDAPDRLNELHRRAAAVLAHLEAGILGGAERQVTPAGSLDAPPRRLSWTGRSILLAYSSIF